MIGKSEKAQDAVEALSQDLIFDDLNEAQINQVRQLQLAETTF
jgi:hypothetical protein